MIVLGNMTQLMQDDIINAVFGRFDQVWIEHQVAFDGAAAPLLLHRQYPKAGHARHPDGFGQQ